MQRFIWCTDIHLNFLNEHGISDFYKQITQAKPKTFLICGDIGEGSNVHQYLAELASNFPKLDIYFVLGNHDIYFNSFPQVYCNIKKLCAEYTNLNWLNESGIVRLSTESALIGNDGWYDGGHGDYFSSSVTIADFNTIKEFSGLTAQARLGLMQNLAKEAADQIKRNLEIALRRYNKIIIATHVPPFKENCLHDGKISNGNYLPFYGNKILGDALLDVMRNYFNSNKQVIVLCGHSHGFSVYNPLQNLKVICGEAKYGTTIIQKTIHIK